VLRRGSNAALNVTALRIVAIPGLMVLILADVPDGRWWAAGVYVAAAATDSLDGWLARSRGQVTVAGAFLDPLADKLLVSAALLALIQAGDLPAWAAMVIITRELAVTGLRLVAVSEDLIIPAASGRPRPSARTSPWSPSSRRTRSSGSTRRCSTPRWC